MLEKIKKLLAEILVFSADKARKSRFFELISKSFLFYTLKEEIFKSFLIEILGMPVDLGIRPLLRLRQSKQTPKIKATNPKEPDLRILFVQPPLPSNNRNKVIFPVGLSSMVAQIRKAFPKVKVGILDSLVHDLDIDGAFNALSEEKWDIVGISAMTCQAPFAYGLADKIREKINNVQIILGGVHPTLCPREALIHCDLVVIGEGEETILDIVERSIQKKALDGTPGTMVKKGEAFSAGPPRALIADLDRLEFAAYDLLPIHLYNNPLHVVGGERLPLFASRGCPYSCSFCNSPQIWHRKVRFRSAKRVLEEVDWIAQTFQIRLFHFWDDNITIKPALLEEICHGFIERKNVRWVALDRAEHLVKNAHLLPLMKKSGCVGIEIGVESVNPETFEYIQKRQGFSDVREAVQLQKQAGLAPLYTCMTFNPGETINGYRYQKIFLDQIQEGLPWYPFFHQLPFPIYLGQFATPYPQTPFLADLPTLGESLAESYDQRFHHFINFVPNSLLGDKPFLNKKPSRADREMMCIVAITGLWDWFDGRSTLRVAAQRLRIMVQIQNQYLEKCQGEKTIRQIVDQIAMESNFHRKIVLQAVALISYVFGQTGHLVSQKQGHSEKIVASRVPITRFHKRLIRRLERQGDFQI